VTAEMQRLQADLLLRGETVACAESLTGGALGETLSAIEGASAFFLGGVISYATEVKRAVLGVTAARVITAECALQMASGVRTLTEATWGVATTGVAGPERQEDQPVGTVFIAVVGPRELVREFHFDGDRAAVRQASVLMALALLQEAVNG
jgi:nicotinamide-nucleotide amidase